MKGIAVTAWHVVFDAIKVSAKFADGASCEVLGFIDYDEKRPLKINSSLLSVVLHD